MIHIACCIDNNFVPHCGVLIVSICENKGLESIHFHILTDGLDTSNEKSLKDIVERYEQSITLYKIDKNNLKNCPIRKNDHISIATYFRILLPVLIPESVHKILYLDCDIIVLENLDSLWNIDIANNSVGAVPDITLTYDIRSYNRLDYEMELGYFNSGVLLINLDYWRKNSLSTIILEYINENVEKLKFHDQDALNYVLRETKVDLPLRFNVVGGFYWKEVFIAKKYWKEMYEAAENPVILHYTNSFLKPWYKECTHPKKDLYWKYKSLSPWKNQKMKHVKFILRIKKIIVKLLVDWGGMAERL